jgi:hypothetical protein
VGDHFLQMQEVLFTGHLSCMVQGRRTKPPEGWLDQILEVYTGVLVFDPLQHGGGGAVQLDTLHAILPTAPRSPIMLNKGNIPVQNYPEQLDAVTVIATPASIGGHPDTVAVDSAEATVRTCQHLSVGHSMNLLVLTVHTAIHDGRLQRVAYQVTTLTSEPYESLLANSYLMLSETDRAEYGPPL